MKDWVGEYLEIPQLELDADTVQMVISELIAHIDNACTEIDWETLVVKVNLTLRGWTIGVKVRANRKEAEEEEEK